MNRPNISGLRSKHFACHLGYIATTQCLHRELIYYGFAGTYVLEPLNFCVFLNDGVFSGSGHEIFEPEIERTPEQWVWKSDKKK